MNATNHPPEGKSIVEINCPDRWTVYRRLLELDIPCTCAPYQPLKVEVTNPAIAIQLWSVLRGVTQSSSQLILWLERCWKLCSYRY